jgi:hypothetical protein
VFWESWIIQRTQALELIFGQILCKGFITDSENTIVFFSLGGRRTRLKLFAWGVLAPDVGAAP